MTLLPPIALVLPGWADFSQYVFSGLTQGCLYALIALAFVVIANVTGVYNFAQGDWIMVGGMVAVAALTAGIPIPVAVLLSMLAVAGVALAQERFTVAPIRERTGLLGLVVATLGVGVLLRGLSLVIWGHDVQSVEPFAAGTFHLLGADLDYQTAYVWGATAFSLAVTVFLFRFTDIGRAMRACALNPVAARLVGIRIGRMSMAAFLLGGALSGLIGAIIVPLTAVSWDSGLALGLVGFIAAALARFENPVGAVVAGLAIGVAQALASGIISSAYSNAIVYSILMVYLVGRGLFGADGSLVRLLHRRTTRAARRAAAALARTARERQRVGPSPSDGQAPPTLAARFQVNPLRAGAVVALLVIAIFVPIVTEGNPQARDAAIFIVLSAIGATGLSLMLGVAGQLSFGQGAFFLLGGYTSGILTSQSGWEFIPAFAAAIAIAVAASFLLGLLTLRLEGFNLAITTLAFHLILLVIVVQYISLTGGPLGVSGMPTFEPLGLPLFEPTYFYWTALGVLVLALIVARNLTFSRIGRALRAMGSDELGAESIGIDTDRLKLGVLCVGGAMGGIAGALWGAYLQYAAPNTWDFTLTIALITYVIVGGASSVYGGVIGAVTVGTISYLVTGGVSTAIGAGSSSFQIILNGGLIVGVILLFPEGIVGILKRLQRRLGPRLGGLGPADSEPGALTAVRDGAADVTAGGGVAR